MSSRTHVRRAVGLLVPLLFCLAFVPAALASGSGHEEPMGRLLPLWSVVPFAALLLAIAVVPLTAPHWWEHNRNKALVSGLLSLVTAGYLIATFGGAGSIKLVHTLLLDYVPFLMLLGALFVIAGGIVLRGNLSGNPETNVIFMAVGAVFASFIGTTGAAMALVRPLIRANAVRENKSHVLVFFIFIVCNVGGLLTPLGDPPLFLGFLKGVPFLWTFKLWKAWLMAVAALLAVFYVVDNVIFRREDRARPGDLDEMVESKQELVLSLAGRRNFWFLGGVMLTVYLSGVYHDGMVEWCQGHYCGVHAEYGAAAIQCLGLLLMAVLSMQVTPTEYRKENGFTFAPIVEVAVLFFGIFVTMIPAIQILNYQGQVGGLPVREPWHFFWASGILSSFLDNAPTYLTFAATAAGVSKVSAEGNFLAVLLQAGPAAEALLVAVACGSVFMGANTYIGNAPNFMVKSIAEENGVRMPSFFGYMAWSGAVLIPLFVIMTFIFFV